MASAGGGGTPIGGAGRDLPVICDVTGGLEMQHSPRVEIGKLLARGAWCAGLVGLFACGGGAAVAPGTGTGGVMQGGAGTGGAADFDAGPVVPLNPVGTHGQL